MASASGWPLPCLRPRRIDLARIYHGFTHAGATLAIRAEFTAEFLGHA
ncbi:MAG: hypothetical protein HOL32_13175 [Octadecabacter sp.]|nr:hypothetical protein [Octadecabacter sp.]